MEAKAETLITSQLFSHEQLKKALIMSIGLGSGIEHAIYFSIRNHNPTLTVFITSTTSQETLEREINGTKIANLTESKTIILKDEEDLEKTYLQIEEAVNLLINEGYTTKEIAIDFTTGTKAMSAALALVATINRLEAVTYVSGDRNTNGRVISGSEKTITIKPAKIALLTELKTQFPTYFNSYQYKTCLKILEQCRTIEELFNDQEKQHIAEAENLVQGYQEWDRFNHKEALQKLKTITQYDVKENVRFLKDLIDERNRLSQRIHHLNLRDKIPTHHLIADLLSNAKRRAEEGSYDNAVARLYRVIEMIAQLHLLEKYQQNTSDIQLETLKNALPAHEVQRYEQIAKERGTIQLDLMESYRLIQSLEPANPFATKEIIEQLKHHLSLRNNSILAHGFKPLGGEAYEKMENLALTIAKQQNPDLEPLLKNQFPKLLIIDLLHN